MAIRIESGIHSSIMVRNDYEIHHSRDNYDDYRPFPKHIEPVHLHHHDFYEIYLFLSGEITYLVENQTYHLSAGDLLLISPMELHQPVFLPGSGFYERIVLWITPACLQQLTASATELLFPFQKTKHLHNHRFHLNENQTKKMQALLDRLVLEMQQPDIYSAPMEMALLTEFLCQTARYSEETSTPPDENRMSLQIAACVDYINEHLSEDLSLDLIASQCYLSKQYMLRCFKTAMGISIHQYIQKKRLFNAKQYIAQGNLPKDAASHFGFHDYSAFYRAFQKEYGVSPGKIQ